MISLVFTKMPAEASLGVNTGHLAGVHVWITLTVLGETSLLRNDQHRYCGSRRPSEVPFEAFPNPKALKTPFLKFLGAFALF